MMNLFVEDFVFAKQHQ